MRKNEDKLSKLFIDKLDQHEEKPRASLWDEIESQLDKDMPVDETKGASETPIRQLTEQRQSYWRYWVAASALVATSLLVLREYTPQSVDPLAKETSWSKSQNTEIAFLLEEEESPIIPEEEEEAYVRTDNLQEQKIIEEAKQKQEKKEDLQLRDVEIVPPAPQPLQEVFEEEELPVEETQVEQLEVESTIPANVSTEPSVTFYQNDQKLSAKDLNYAEPPIANTMGATIKVEELAKVDEAMTEEAQDEIIVENKAKKESSSKRMGLRASRKSKSKESKRSKSSRLHGRLAQFSWMLGTWVDNNEEEGISYEQWKQKGRNVLTGHGYKLSKQGEKIFEENMEIEYVTTLRQVFLHVQLSSTKEKVSYLLSSFDSDRIHFKQKDYADYPEEIIIQREMYGFSTIILSQGQSLTAEQQRYLDSRNRVSNHKAIRTLERK